jgi:subtilisin family serine protease
MKKNPVRFRVSNFTAGILLPIFLFTLIPLDLQAADNIKIIFALGDQSQAAAVLRDHPLISESLVFKGTDALPQTYRAEADSSVVYSLLQDPRILYVESDYSVQASAITANDTFFTTDTLADEKQWYLPKVKIPDAWEFGRGTGSVTVAIIDTGIHAQHLELNDGRIIEGYNTVTNQAIAANSNSDDNGHGTAVAGVIGAIPNNGKGIAGINWNIKLMPIKALNADGTGAISSVAAAIVWAADHGVQIINLSLGGPGFGADATLNNAVQYAFNKGILIVAAAGNDLADQGINLDQNPVYPICSDLGANMVLGVAASDTFDRKASFSNFGINCVDITAPGKKILTTAFLPSDPGNNILIYGSGTSLATPIVSGVAALLKSNNGNLTNVELRDILLRSTDNIDALNQDNCLNSSCNGFLGKGRLNALTAVAPQPIGEGSLVREAVSGKVFQISAGLKRFVSNFVFNQRGYSLASVKNEVNNQLASYVLGPSLPPLEGTLIKSQSDATVYVINQELRRPLTYLVFVSRGYSFANVNVLSDAEVLEFPIGEWYWPPDGTMVLIEGNPTVYVMDKQVRRAVTYFVFIQRKLSFAKVIKVPESDFSHIPAPPDPYWLPPLDGTLVKSSSSPEVYVIEAGTRRPLSYQAFVARRYSFRNVKTLPQAEIDVIAPGSPIVN